MSIMNINLMSNGVKEENDELKENNEELQENIDELEIVSKTLNDDILMLENTIGIFGKDASLPYVGTSRAEARILSY